MKIILFILFIASIVISCSNDHQAADSATTSPEKYDINKDTTVSTG